MNEAALRELICEVGRRMYVRNLVAATDGNISVRLGPDRFLCTPNNCCKGFMRSEDIVVADGRGEKIEGLGRVTTEFYTHLAAYEERPDIEAVIHGHTPMASALMLAGLRMDEYVLPEVVMSLGRIPTTAYATPGSPEGANVVRVPIRNHDAVLLDRHGVVTVGRDLLEAYYRLEKVENAAQMLAMAHCLGRVAPLEPAQVDKLLAVLTKHRGY